MILRYDVPIDDRVHERRMPVGARIVHVGMSASTRGRAEMHRGGVLDVWAECPRFPSATVMVEAPHETRALTVVGTGQAYPEGAWRHAGTFTDPSYSLVWHVLEREQRTITADVITGGTITAGAGQSVTLDAGTITTAPDIRMTGVPVRVRGHEQHVHVDADGRIARTPDDWQAIVGRRIVDADGWRTPDAPAWDEPITRGEFDRRAAQSTTAPYADGAVHGDA